MDKSVCRLFLSRTRIRAAVAVAALVWGMMATGPLKAETTKEQQRCAYVMKQMKMAREGRTKFAPVFMAYQKELKAAKAGYNGLKDRLRSSIKGNRLTDAQARQLLDAHWASDEKELEVKRRYTNTFIRMVGAKAAFNVFRFANDKEATK